MEKFLGIFPRICRNFSMNMSENFLGIIPKLIPRNIHSKTSIGILEALLVSFGATTLHANNSDQNPSLVISIGKIPSYICYGNFTRN
jgi:hypothetical protein